jgi:hypothetical protein
LAEARLLPAIPAHGERRWVGGDGLATASDDRARRSADGVGLGDGTRQLSGLIAATLTAGGDGYCVHATLEARPDTRDLAAVVRQTADRCLAVPERDDFVHYDFTLADLLTTGPGISGVIDINPPALTGDRAFDLATLLFYLYDRHDIHERLRGRALELTSTRALSATSRTCFTDRSTSPCATTPCPLHHAPPAPGPAGRGRPN